MTPEFKEFLTATDLDDLMSARDNISHLEPEDIEELVHILQKWEDQQAVANILMYADLIPADIRIGYLQKGLKEDQVPYFALAAVVGLSHLNLEALTGPELTGIVEQVIAIIKNHPGVIAERASAFLADNFLYLHKNYTAEVVGFLDDPNEVVRHNTLVMLLSVLGLRKIHKFLNAAAASQKISPEARQAAEEQLCTIRGYKENNIPESAQFNLGSLGISLLSYIPNLNEFA